MLYRPPKGCDADGNTIYPKTGPGGNTNPAGHQQRAQGVVDKVKGFSDAFRAKKEAFLTPPDAEKKPEKWS